MIEFTIPGSPVAKGRPRFARIGGFVRAYTPKETADHEDFVAECARRHFPEPLSGALRVEVILFMPMPKRLRKADKQAALLGSFRPVSSRSDVDNHAKAVLDGLQGVAYKNDCAVVELEVRKFYGLDPRTIVKVCRV